ncbi:MAG: hypothetical protein WC365_07465 [Candidatus Babeliales bacterium]|jgi:hypothetical protein
MKDVNSDTNLECCWCGESTDLHILQKNYQDKTDIAIGWLIACVSCGKISVIGEWKQPSHNQFQQSVTQDQPNIQGKLYQKLAEMKCDMPVDPFTRGWNNAVDKVVPKVLDEAKADFIAQRKKINNSVEAAVIDSLWFEKWFGEAKQP